ncbi:uncharacterized protein EAE97_001058 [Botrytis byssoidea]|uniref:Uncharacterized protein n=1 Tax=Botrytis byssoidea TaxID=139641 RepID=A0A9P5IWW3_9HELO|nr:uncharacterized protein EAE97_001058 [Botrytis byssoidea]KAF7953659.1 hypothetical protein EAE97_001058 [Botrytis byssoidea]
MSSTNNNNGKGKGTFPKEGLPITFKQGSHSRRSADLVAGHPKTTGSSTKTSQASSSKPSVQIRDDSESNSDRREEARRGAYKDLTGRYPSSSDSDKKEKEKGKAKAKK